MWRSATVLPALVAAGLLAPPAAAQTFDDARTELSARLRQAHFASSFAALITLSREVELSSARYRIDGSPDESLSTTVLPFRTTFWPGGEDSTGLYVEGGFGYATNTARAADLYSGLIPEIQTSVKTTTSTLGGLIGAGPQIPIGEGLWLTPILNAGVARLENETDYSGPGAEFSAALLDGLAFNWSAWTASLGTALRVDWLHDLDAEHGLELIGRYDLRWTQTISSDDDAQEFSTRLQLLTLRAEATGPTGVSAFGNPVGWRGQVGYRNFAEGNLFGVKHLFQVGGSLEFEPDWLPIGREVALSGGLTFGDNITGFSIGIGFDF